MMVWKAIRSAAKYKEGDVVPDVQALDWYNRYDDPPVRQFPDEEEVKKKEPKPVERNPLDLNGDGKFDHKDVSLGAKAMAAHRKIKRSKKKGSK